MKQYKNEYEVIIVGGDHHNGLGLARIFGINHIKVHSYVISNSKKSFLRKSRFVNDCNIYANEKLAYDLILSRYGNKRNKFFIIPYSDSAALELDLRLNEFLGFMLPSIKGEQGALARMMDKSVQYLFAKENGIRMAETITYYFDEKNDVLFAKYPCIVKPVISAEGEKRDIDICESLDELNKKLNELKKKGYKRVLIQEYLKIDYEIDVFGCILKQKPYICQIPTKTIRSWPIKGGTNSFSKILTDEDTINQCRRIIECLIKTGFYGLYDIELFVVGNEIVLNEINYRNSGDVYMGINQKYYYPYAWTEDYMGHMIQIADHPHQPVYTMTEGADLRNVFVHEVSLNKWIKDFYECEDYALKFKGDMKPAINRYVYYVKQFIKGKRL